MIFELFSRLYDETKDYTSRDMYIGERGWQDWMDVCADKGVDVGQLLTRIWDIAHMDIKALRGAMELSQGGMAKLYGIPKRTIENWEAGVNAPPPYLVKLLAYTVVGNA